MSMSQLSQTSQKIRLQVSGMTCSGCSEAVKRVIRKHDTDAMVDVDLDTGRVDVVTHAAPDALAAAVTKAGYQTRVA
jgi:copper chaperone